MTLRLLVTPKWASLPSLSEALHIHPRRLHASAVTRRNLGARYARPSHVPVEAAPPPRPPPVAAKPAGPRDKVVEVEGVRIPPKPIPPGDEDCCMSGCVHCVLTIYADDLEEYNSAMDAARAKLEVRKVPRAKWPHVMDEADGEEEEAPKLDPAMAAFAALESKLAGRPAAPPPPKAKPKPAMDPGLSAFMALEAKLKKKHEHDAV
ncbi:hypothetical protein CC85DRAFT_288143 [Cutaneotrichosporon oleaginosum]|uniref:Oxidoreductase-like domain-containing protein n=1 Tax=Cutaneotrichosporon oleaginosum TaxID=879819 RepID=A0A0J0XFH6_9TREE|nr:uncharacterized protein CC85DRAFT_288143 [Cutaneotrichosporon oleaginosum]KLT39803.1 hypothetical protein CC85DRAFT_288143 [Cutaneotrichosporon oleaginosum]TXT10328.1 hypothetical protein COLE_04262 [Cutaneotrichosporon oleaginosum]